MSAEEDENTLAYAVRSWLSPNVWSPIVPGAEITQTTDNAGGIWAVKRYLNNDAAVQYGYDDIPRKWVHESDHIWALVMEGTS